MSEKLHFEGEIVAVQPRIRLLRSFDERSHTYLGYLLGISGVVGGDKGDGPGRKRTGSMKMPRPIGGRMNE